MKDLQAIGYNADMKTTDYCMIHTTTGNKADAERIATALLEARLVACAQQSSIESHYRWNGRIVRDEEILLQLKTKTVHFDAISALIKALHSYETAEIVMLPIIDASADYLAWIDKEVK